jgi:hypothetical protein
MSTFIYRAVEAMQNILSSQGAGPADFYLKPPLISPRFELGPAPSLLYESMEELMSFIKQSFEKVTHFIHCFGRPKGKKTECARDDQKHVMTEEELLDETIDDSFPASDPPGHYSKSAEDKLLHQ